MIESKMIRFSFGAFLMAIGLAVIIVSIALAYNLLAQGTSHIAVQTYKDGYIEGLQDGYKAGRLDTVREILINPYLNPMSPTNPLKDGGPVKPYMDQGKLNLNALQSE